MTCELSNRPGIRQPTHPHCAKRQYRRGVKLLPPVEQHGLEVSKVKRRGRLHLNLVSRGEQNNWQDLGEESQDTPEKPAKRVHRVPPPAISIEGVDDQQDLAWSIPMRSKRAPPSSATSKLHTGRLDSETRPGRPWKKVELQGTYVSQPLKPGRPRWPQTPTPWHAPPAGDTAAANGTPQHTRCVQRRCSQAPGLLHSARTGAIALDNTSSTLWRPPRSK